MRMSKFAVHATLASGCIGIAIIASASSSVTATSATSWSQPTQDDVSQALAMVGITPEHLCIVGASSGQIQSVVGASIEFLQEHWAGIESTQQSLTTQATEVARLKELVSRGLATPTDRDALTAAQETLANIQGDLDEMLDGLRSDSLQYLTSEQWAWFDRLVANRALPIPPEYRILVKSEMEWVQFRKAYSEYKTNPDASSASETAVETADSDLDVAVARTRLQNTLATTKAAFASALAG